MPESRPGEDFLDIEAVSTEIRARVTRRMASAPPGGSASLGPELRRPSAQDNVPPLRLAAGEALADQIAGELSIGRMPSSPPTIRGRLGRLLVAFVRRSLFWLIPQIESFQRAIGVATKEEISALRTLARRIADLRSDQRAMQSVLLDRLGDLRQTVQRSAMQLQAEIGARGQADARITSVSNDLRDIDRKVAALDELATKLQHAVQSILEDRLAEIHQNVQRRAAEIHAEIGARERAEGRIDELAAKLRYLEEYSRFTRAYLLAQSQRFGRPQIEPAHAPLNEPIPQRVDSVMEASYLEFQRSFRGEYGDIKARLTVYLDHLNGELGRANAPLLDIGCGRGEWLSLLRDHNFVGYGVDSNPGMVQACMQDGFLVQQEDGLTHLRGLPAESLGGVTAFHVIEHLSPPILEMLLDEILRVLKPQGIVILETPDPRNVSVASRTFYLDPTHQKPLPSELMQYLLETRGFTEIEVLRLHPYPEEAKLKQPGDPAAEFIDEYFFGPQDYAIICRTPLDR
jgi:O-antigen chain-terminating methyltransferase